MAFKKATRLQARLRMALAGPSGSGKTFTALSIAAGLGAKVAVIDTERGSAAKYSGADGFSFDVCELAPPYHPQKYIDAICEAEEAGYDVLIIDSLSHAWAGEGGALDLVDAAQKRQKGAANSFTAFKEITPLQNKLVHAIASSRCHIISTLRVKTEYVLETNSNGKQAPRKVGLKAIQRDDLDYEQDVYALIDINHNMIVEKTRCSALTDAVFSKAGADVAAILRAWLTDGEAPAPARSPVPPAARALAPELLAPELLRRLASAASLEAVKLVARDVKLALDAGHLTDADLETLRAERARVEGLINSVSAERTAVPS